MTLRPNDHGRLKTTCTYPSRDNPKSEIGATITFLRCTALPLLSSETRGELLLVLPFLQEKVTERQKHRVPRMAAESGTLWVWLSREIAYNGAASSEHRNEGKRVTDTLDPC